MSTTDSPISDPPSTPLPAAPIAQHPSPWRLLVVTAASIFAAETAVMLFLHLVLHPTAWVEALLDSTSLTLLVTPVLYTFLFRPMVGQINERMRAEEMLRRARDQLELQVLVRTAELQTANTELERQIGLCKRVEAALSESEEAARALMNATGETAMLMYLDGGIIAINETGARRLGMRPEQLTGICVYDLFSPQSGESRRAMGYEAARTGMPVRFEDERDGVWFDNTMFPVRDADGCINRLAVLAIDISHRKQAELEREALISQLRDTLSRVKTLSGLLPICASCKKIRDDKGYWNQIEEYVRDHTEADFTHGICPDCMEKLYPGFG